MLEDGTPSQEMQDDVILPDDFSEDTSTPAEEPSTEQVEETTQEEQPTEEQNTTPDTVEEAQKIKVKFNHEERELTLEEATLLAQKGMNYDKVQEKLNALQSDPRLSFIEELAQESGMTTEQYIEAVRQQREQEKLNELVQQNIPEELAQEILSNRKFREEWEAQQKAQQEQEKRNTDLNEFLETFKQNNGRAYDPDKDKLPDSVWEEVKKGKSLADAYTRHENQQLKNRIKVLEQNMANLKASPVAAVTAHGSQEVAEEDDFLAGFNEGW